MRVCARACVCGSGVVSVMQMCVCVRACMCVWKWCGLQLSGPSVYDSLYFSC